MIAAHSRPRGLVLVSNNARELQRVPALRFENWVSAPDREPSAYRGLKMGIHFFTSLANSEVTGSLNNIKGNTQDPNSRISCLQQATQKMCFDKTY